MMKDFWHRKRVLVTGGTGFIGSYVAEILLKKGSDVSVTTLDDNFENISGFKKDLKILRANLTDFKDAKRVTKSKDVVLNLASKVAGIQYNVNHPVEMFEDNISIAKNVISAAYQNNVGRLLIVSSACVYSSDSRVPNIEQEGFLGDPESTNLGYGWAKRVSELLGRFYFQEYGFKIAIARPFNAYGPRDNFDPRFSHVIPGIIKRVFDGENPLIVWGSGKQTRSFIYAEDFAKGLLRTVEKYCVSDPVNIGSSEEITIKDLAYLIARLSGKKLKIKFDRRKPDGQPRRMGSVKKAKTKLGFESKTSLKEGLERTIEWYKHL